jgi:ABC-type uncharacterized transport system permease subunit
VRWEYRDAALVWLFVPAYIVHLAEEWSAGFPSWVRNVVGRPLPEAAFLIINGVALVVMVAAIRAATRAERHGWTAIAIATVMLVNAALHAAGTVLTGTYSPGLISAVVVYVPLGSLVMMRALDQARREQVARGVAAGILIHAIVVVVAFVAARGWR